LSLLGRRNDGVSIDQVRAELAVISTQFNRAEPERATTLTVDRAKPETLPPFVRGAALGGAAVIMLGFAMLLCIACANIGNLLLARTTQRRREFALRMSLGARRIRLVRQLLFESLAVSIIGGVLGSLAAIWAFQHLLELAIPTIVPVGLPPLAIDASPDFRVLTLMSALALGTGIVFGLAPAMRASRADLHSVIKSDSAGTGESPGRNRLQAVLLGAQAAMCMLLIIGAGLLIRGLNAAQAIDPGFDPAGVTVLSYDYTENTGHEDDPAFWQLLRTELASLPGVEAVAYASREPLGDDSGLSPIRRPGTDEFQSRSAVFNSVGPEYFSTVGLSLTGGRAFTDADLSSDDRVAIISESTARNLWGSQNPLGQTLLWGPFPFAGAEEIEFRIIGVVADAQLSALGQIDPYYVYVPSSIEEKLLIRSRLDAAPTAAAIREVVRRLDPSLPAPIYPLTANLERWRGISGIVALLASGLGAVALALAGVGIYGVVAFFVGRRLREMGVRLALGAGAGGIYRLILSRTMLPVAVGATIGIAVAVAFSGILSSLLFGIRPLDPIGIGGAMLFVLAIALASGGWAARRATASDPIATLRHD
jgi:predicted permease